MISVVCVYNNEDILNSWLLKSLKNQTVEFELIKIDNTKGIFKSAPEALNYGGCKAKGKYIMFVHQDLNLCSNRWLEDGVNVLDSISDLGIAGVAGMRKTKISRMFNVGTSPIESRVGILYHGDRKEPWLCNKNFTEPVEVQTLDEQMLIIPRNIFENLKFDEKTCNGWHLYGVDYSLCVQKLGLKAYVIPLPVWHHSTGSLNESYYVTLNKMFIKHRKYEYIYATCGLWYTSNFLNCFSLLIMAMRSEIGRFIGRDNVGVGPFIVRIKSLLNGLKKIDRSDKMR